jgi:hypothetical protein
MSGDSERVTALIKELLSLNRAEGTSPPESPTAQEIEGRKSERKRIRQELVQVLNLSGRRKT